MTSPLAAGTARHILLMFVLGTLLLFSSGVLARHIERKQPIERKLDPRNGNYTDTVPCCGGRQNSTHPAPVPAPSKPKPVDRDINILKAMHTTGNRPYVRLSLNSTIANSTFINFDILDEKGSGLPNPAGVTVQWQLGQQSLDSNKNGLRKAETWILKPYVAKANTFYLGISDINSTLGIETDTSDGTLNTRIGYLDPFFKPDTQLFKFQCRGGPAKINAQRYIATGCLMAVRGNLETRRCLRAYDYKWPNGTQSTNSTDPTAKYGPNLRGRIAGAACSRNDTLQLWAIEDVSHEFTADNHNMTGDIRQIPAPPVRYDLTPGQN